MDSTDRLIARLADGLTPVARLARPWARAIGLVLLASGIVVLLVLLRGLRADMADRMVDGAYWLQLTGAWLTGAAATLAAFEVSLPDRSRGWLLLPLPA